MEPMTMYIIAQAAVGLASTAWNFFAGGSAIDAQKEKVRQQKEAMAAQEKQNQLQIKQQFTQGQSDVTQANGSQAADLAARGIAGEGAVVGMEGAAADRTKRLDQWHQNALTSDALQYKNQMAGIDQANADITNAENQRNMDLFIGLGGVGLSAAAGLIKGGVWKAPTPGVSSAISQIAPSQFQLPDLQSSFMNGGFDLGVSPLRPLGTVGPQDLFFKPQLVRGLT